MGRWTWPRLTRFVEERPLPVPTNRTTASDAAQAGEAGSSGVIVSKRSDDRSSTPSPVGGEAALNALLALLHDEIVNAWRCSAAPR